MSQLRPAERRLGAWPSLVAMVALLALLWVLEVVDQASGNALDAYGIRPRSDEGLVGVFTAPLLHVGWEHLLSNSVPLLVLGFLVLLGGWRRWAAVTLAAIVGSGAVVWLVSPPGSMTLGASGVVFGWLAYLLLRGFFSRSLAELALAAALMLLYGGILWGVLPTDAGISWQGHLGGALGGAVAARALHRRAPFGPRPHVVR